MPSVFVPLTSFMKNEYCLALYLLERSKSCGDGIGNVWLIFILCLYLTSCSFQICQVWLEQIMDVLGKLWMRVTEKTDLPTFSPPNPTQQAKYILKQVRGDKKMGGWLCPGSHAYASFHTASFALINTYISKVVGLSACSLRKISYGLTSCLSPRFPSSELSLLEILQYPQWNIWNPYFRFENNHLGVG